MTSIGRITFYGFLVGIVGTGLGGLISLFIKDTKKIQSFLLGLTGGFMLFIVTFHLLPEAFLLGGLLVAILGVILGILLVVILEGMIQVQSKNTFMRSAILLGISIAVHNFPEGLALGSSFIATAEFGSVLSLAMLLHNIPEGISMAIPMKINKTPGGRIVLLTILTGLPTGIGAFIGAYVGMISNTLVSLCLSFAGGTMLYIICDEIIPSAKTLHKGRVSSIALVIGFIIGFIVYF